MRIRSLLPFVLLCSALANIACQQSNPGEEDDDELLSANGCGVERWDVKTGTDAAAAQVNMTAQDTTIVALRALPAPSGNASGSARHAGTAEMQLWRLSNVTLVEYKLESDSDYHLVLKDAAGNTMIAEIPSPTCVTGGSWGPAITAARNAMNAKYTVTSSFQAANVPVTVTGVGFFDLLHGQTGVAPNAIELHAVQSICFPGSTISGCGPATPDFSLTPNPATVSGAAATSAIAVGASGGFAGAVSLVASGLPAGASASFSPASVAPGATATLTLTAGNAAAGTYPVTITGTSGTLTHTASVGWTIGASGTGFSLTANPSAVTTPQASLGSATIAVADLGTFPGTVALAVSGAPAGASATLSTSSIAGNGSAILGLAAGSAAPGSYSLLITGTSGTITHSAAVAWTISGASGGAIVNGGFESGLSGWTSTGTNAASTVAHGGAASAQVGSATVAGLSSLSQTFAVSGTGAKLSFWYQGFCNDTVTYGWATATLADNTARTSATLLARTCTRTGQWVQVTSAALAAAHSYTLTLSSQGEVYQTKYNDTLFDDVQLSGNAAPDFSLSLAAASENGSATDAITVSPLNGFSSAVALTVSGVPSGATATASPASVTSGQSTLTLAPGSAAAGTYSLTIAATGGGVSHSVSLSWTIGSVAAPDFSLSLSAASVASTGSAAASDVITVTPANGFTGAVALSVSQLPSGAASSFNPASVSSGNSTLTLTPGTAPNGTYQLAVTGSGGGKTHTAALSWTLSAASGGGNIQTVFLILEENHNWSQMAGSASAPYLNKTLLPQASYALKYGNPPGIHPSLPNYLWLEAGTNFGILADGVPSQYHQSTTQHLVTLLQNAGISWKNYSENISGTNCPLTNSGTYLTRHDPMIFFDDVTNTNNASSANCIAHIRPLTELATDLSNNTVPRYAFITPNACDDGHNATGCSTTDEIRNTDTWLQANLPAILNSAAYRNNGAIFITWDESEGGDVPIGMIVLSPKAKGHGYSNSISYTHGSTLRTMEEIFNVQPMLGAAATSTDLSDLFTSFP